jgi:AraC-like DNA-binding protein
VTTLHNRDLPAPDRFGWFCEVVARDLAPHAITSDHIGDFRASMLSMSLDRIRVSAVFFPTLGSARTHRLIQRSDPELLELALVVRGDMEIEQGGNRCRPSDGDLVLYDSSRPYVANCVSQAGGGGSVVLHLPRRAVPVPDRTLHRLTAAPLPSRTGTGALLGGLLGGLVEQAATLNASRLARVGSALGDLAAAFLADLAGTEGLLTPETRQEVLLLEVKAFIRRHLGDPALSPGVVAAAHHISPRSLHNLFRREDRTVGEFIREQRLERCRQDLGDPDLATRSVRDIGRRWGFTDPSVFSRVFKTRYGVAPGTHRQHPMR